jgi:hypothetical protein
MLTNESKGPEYLMKDGFNTRASMLSCTWFMVRRELSYLEIEGELVESC